MHLLRVVALALVAALAVNMHCYAACIASEVTQKPACHSSEACHHSSQHESGKRSNCNHQQQAFARSDARPAAMVFNSQDGEPIGAPAAIRSLTAELFAVSLTRQAQRGSPPLLSVLRI